MNDPFPTVEDSHPVLAIDFDWDEIDRNEGEVRQAMRGGDVDVASETVSMLVAICGEGVHKVRVVKRRASTVGIRFLCASLLMRPGQIKPKKVSELSKTLGVSEQHLYRVIALLRSRMASASPSQG